MKIVSYPKQIVKIQVHRDELVNRYDPTFQEKDFTSLEDDDMKKIVNYVLDDLHNNDNLIFHSDHIPTYVTFSDDIAELTCQGITVKDSAYMEDEPDEQNVSDKEETGELLVLCFHNVFEASEFVITSGLSERTNKILSNLYKYDSRMYLFLYDQEMTEKQIVSLTSLAYTVSGIKYQPCRNKGIIMEHGERIPNAIKKLACI